MPAVLAVPILDIPVLDVPVLDIPVLDIPVLIEQVDAALSDLRRATKRWISGCGQSCDNLWGTAMEIDDGALLSGET
jgi:hypothetical protein